MIFFITYPINPWLDLVMPDLQIFVYNCVFRKKGKTTLTKSFTFWKWKHISKKNHILKMKAKILPSNLYLCPQSSSHLKFRPLILCNGLEQASAWAFNKTISIQIHSGTMPGSQLASRIGHDKESFPIPNWKRH